MQLQAEGLKQVGLRPGERLLVTALSPQETSRYFVPTKVDFLKQRVLDNVSHFTVKYSELLSYTVGGDPDARDNFFMEAKDDLYPMMREVLDTGLTKRAVYRQARRAMRNPGDDETATRHKKRVARALITEMEKMAEIIKAPYA